MSSIFTKIINREIPAPIVYEDDVCIVIMDKFPAVNGQSLVVSKEEIAYILDLPDETYTHMFEVAKKIARASDKVFETIRSCIVVEGFEVPHVHIKIYPMTETKEVFGLMMNKVNEKSDTELQIQTDKIKAALIE